MSPVYLIYQQLLEEYGQPSKYWPQWCAANKTIEDREKITIGMILVQRTSWHNANTALKNLKKENLLSLEAIANLRDLDFLTQLIRPAGFFQSKPKRLFDICRFFTSQGDIFQTTREQLLSLKGIGPETADTILLYGLDKPNFIIDEYTRRFVAKHQLTSGADYHRLQEYFQGNLPEDVVIYQNFHALIIIDQRGPSRSGMEIV